MLQTFALFWLLSQYQVFHCVIIMTSNNKGGNIMNDIIQISSDKRKNYQKNSFILAYLFLLFLANESKFNQKPYEDVQECKRTVTLHGHWRQLNW